MNSLLSFHMLSSKEETRNNLQQILSFLNDVLSFLWPSHSWKHHIAFASIRSRARTPGRGPDDPDLEF